MHLITKPPYLDSKLDLIKISSVTKAPILTEYRKSFETLAKENNIQIPTPISFWEWTSGKRYAEHILIDDLEFTLMRLLGFPKIDYCTFNQRDVPEIRALSNGIKFEDYKSDMNDTPPNGKEHSANERN